MVELRVHVRQNGRVLPLYTTCIEKMTLTSPNKVYRNIGRILDGLELIKVVADELNIYVNEKGRIDFVSAVLENSDGKNKA